MTTLDDCDAIVTPFWILFAGIAIHTVFLLALYTNLLHNCFCCGSSEKHKRLGSKAPINIGIDRDDIDPADEDDGIFDKMIFSPNTTTALDIAQIPDDVFSPPKDQDVSTVRHVVLQVTATILLFFLCIQMVVDLFNIVNGMKQFDSAWNGYQCYVLIVIDSPNFKAAILTLYSVQFAYYDRHKPYGLPLLYATLAIVPMGLILPAFLTHFLPGLLIYVWFAAGWILACTVIFWMIPPLVRFLTNGRDEGGIVTASFIIVLVLLVMTMAGKFYDGSSYMEAFKETFQERGMSTKAYFEAHTNSNRFQNWVAMIYGFV